MFAVRIFSTVSLKNEILETLKCYISICDKKRYQTHSRWLNCDSSSVLMLKFILYSRPRFYWRKLKQFSHEHWHPIMGNICDRSGVMSTEQTETASVIKQSTAGKSDFNKAGGFILEKMVGSRLTNKWSINWGYHTLRFWWHGLLPETYY